MMDLNEVPPRYSWIVTLDAPPIIPIAAIPRLYRPRSATEPVVIKLGVAAHYCVEPVPPRQRPDNATSSTIVYTCLRESWLRMAARNPCLAEDGGYSKLGDAPSLK